MIIYYLLPFLIQANHSPGTSPPKKYSIRYGAQSRITLPIDNVFHVEIKKPEAFVYSEGKSDAEVKTADFCQAQNPVLSIELNRTQSVCHDACKTQACGGRLFILTQDKYLKILTLNGDMALGFVQEVLVPLNNFSNAILRCNSRDDQKILILDGNQARVSEFDLEAESLQLKTYNHSLNTSLSEFQSVEFFQNNLYLYSKGTLEIHRLSPLLESKVATIDFNSRINGDLKKQTHPDESLNETHWVGYSLNMIFQIVITNTSAQITQKHLLYGRINQIAQYNKQLYVIQQTGPKLFSQQFLLEYENFVQRQNLSLSTKALQLLPTNNYIIVRQENMIQMAFAQIDSGQLFSKSILEETNNLLLYQNNKLLVQQYSQVSSYDIYQQKASLICEPNENYSTGTYKLELRVGFFQNESKVQLNQLIDLYVYQEIFENGNVGLYVGLTMGLIITFLVVLVSCVIYYKLKAKYEQNLANSQSITLD